MAKTQAYLDFSQPVRQGLRRLLRPVFPKGIDCRSYIYSATFPVKLDGNKDEIVRQAKDWVRRQSGYGGYGKYAELAGKIMNSGIIYDPRIHRSYITKTILEYGRAVVQGSALHIAINTLRILKCKDHSNHEYAYLVKHICPHTNEVMQLSASIKGKGYHTAKEAFSALSGVSNWHQISLRRPPKVFHAAFTEHSLGKYSYYQKNRQTYDEYREAREDLQEDICNFGYASATIYLADFGDSYKWCKAYVQELRTLRDMLLSKKDSDIDYALQQSKMLLSEISEVYNRAVSDVQDAEAHTSVFGE